MWKEEDLELGRSNNPTTAMMDESDKLPASRKVSSGACSSTGGGEVEVIVFDEEGRPSNEDAAATAAEVRRCSAASSTTSSLKTCEALAEKVGRTATFLTELKTLSASLEEQPMNQEDEELNKGRQVLN